MDADLYSRTQGYDSSVSGTSEFLLASVSFALLEQSPVSLKFDFGCMTATLTLKQKVWSKLSG